MLRDAQQVVLKSLLAVVVLLVRVVSLSKVTARCPHDDVGGFCRGGREEGGSLKANRQGQGGWGAQASRPSIFIHGTVSGRSGQSEN